MCKKLNQFLNAVFVSIPILSFLPPQFLILDFITCGELEGVRKVTLAAVVAAFLSIHEGPPSLGYPRGSAALFGLNGLALQRQIWSPESWNERKACTFRVALSKAELVTVRKAWVRDVKHKREK